MYVGGTSFGRFLFRAQKEDLAYETYNQGSYPASPLRKPLLSRKAGIICCIKTYPVFYQKKDSLILALSKGPTSFSEALEKAFLEYSRDWFLNNRQYETCRDQDLARWHRFADWFFEQGYQILKTRLCSAISVNTSCNHVAVSELSAQADLVLKKGSMSML